MSNERPVSALAREIRERLAQAQGSQAPAGAAPAATPTEPNDSLRVTKDGRLLQPGEPVPPDAGAVSVVPDATFHTNANAASEPARRPLFISKDAAALIRRVAASSDAEHGGVLIGSPVHGDVAAFVPAPECTKRSRIVICFRGRDIESDVAGTIAAYPGCVFVGFVHSHDGLDTLSSGDHDTLKKLHGDERLPPFGLVCLLAVKHGASPIRLRAWISRAPNVVEEMDLCEVDEPAKTRVWGLPEITAPNLRPHILGTRGAIQRFEEELDALKMVGYAVSADCAARGVEVLLEHADMAGMLVLTIPAEGWERPPRIEIRRAGRRVEHVATPLANFCAAWSSAFTLTDLVTFVRARSIWARKATKSASGLRRAS
jgi:hypothetical protein